jgi:hypothetical protein
MWIKAVALSLTPVPLLCRVTNPIAPGGADRVPAPPRFVQQALPEETGDTVEYNFHVRVLSELSISSLNILKVPSLSVNHSPFSVWLVNGYVKAEATSSRRAGSIRRWQNSAIFSQSREVQMFGVQLVTT